MSSQKKNTDQSRRDFLKGTVGIAAGAAAVVAAGASRLFAGQFLKDAPQGQTPSLVYDPEKQVMVDPDTGEPAYATAAGGTTKKEWTAVVTPGPKGDGRWDYYSD